MVYDPGTSSGRGHTGMASPQVGSALPTNKEMFTVTSYVVTTGTSQRVVCVPRGCGLGDIGGNALPPAWTQHLLGHTY